MGNPIMIEQQRLTIRDLLAAGETTMNSIPFIKESSFTNYADMVAEEGEKPEATLGPDHGNGSGQKDRCRPESHGRNVCGFPDDAGLREYPPFFHGKGERRAAASERNRIGQPDHRYFADFGYSDSAKGGDTTPMRFTRRKPRFARNRHAGGYEPDGLVIHPTDWQLLRSPKTTINQYYGGGPFTGQYGVGGGTVE
jgi:hypothetical protein